MIILTSSDNKILVNPDHIMLVRPLYEWDNKGNQTEVIFPSTKVVYVKESVGEISTRIDASLEFRNIK